MPRFVVLRHELPSGGPRASHWDLMFEWGGALRTWAVECEPLSAGPLDALQLPDHRLEYLEYEGPVSGERGTVARWDAGQYVVEHDDADHWEVTLAGTRLVGRMTLGRLAPGHSWRVSFSAAPIKG